MGLDYSFGPHYYNSNIGNPFVGSFNLSYEYVLKKHFGVEIGAKCGGFYQNIEYGENEFKEYHEIYKGHSFSPFISPKFYYSIYNYDKFEHHGQIFLSIKLLYSFSKLKLDRITDYTGSSEKSHFNYEIKVGYEYPIDKDWRMSFWGGYNSFNFSKINPSIIKFKNSTPIQIGIGFHYLFL